jgi:hypothetical protein
MARRRARVPLIAALLLALACHSGSHGASSAAADGDAVEASTVLLAPDGTPIAAGGWKMERNGWTLVVTYHSQGTRSEGLRGRLYHGATEVPGVVDGQQTLDTPLGRLRFYRGEGWDPAGWLCAIPRLNAHSYAAEQFDSCIPPPCAPGLVRMEDEVQCCRADQYYNVFPAGCYDCADAGGSRAADCDGLRDGGAGAPEALAMTGDCRRPAARKRRPAR